MKKVYLSLSAIVLLLFVSGCMSNTQYRVNKEVGHYNEERSDCPTCMMEQGEDYTLGYVELDEQGWFWNHDQVSTITNTFSEKLKGEGAVLLTFIHGWKHNASDGDENVKMFHKVLRQLATMEKVLAKKTGKPQRQVLGVYVGWRGLTHTIEPLKEMTFWGRKSAAEVVGHGAVIELLAELEKLRDTANRQYAAQIKAGTRATTKMVTAGHSFGADVLYSAAAPILIQRLVQDTDADGNVQKPKSCGDLVVLVNPAFEAARFQTIHRLSEDKDFQNITNCTLAVFTSANDIATKIAFPLGRGLNMFGEVDTYRNSEQQRANVTALGHYQPYITHDLLLMESGAQRQEKAAATNAVAQAALVEQSTRLIASVAAQVQENAQKKHLQPTEGIIPFSHCKLVTRPAHLHNEPVYVVSVSKEIVPDHNVIDNWVFIRFLSEFVAAYTEGAN